MDTQNEKSGNADSKRFHFFWEKGKRHLKKRWEPRRILMTYILIKIKTKKKFLKKSVSLYRFYIVWDYKKNQPVPEVNMENKLLKKSVLGLNAPTTPLGKHEILRITSLDRCAYLVPQLLQFTYLSLKL